jgi:predicted MFS family arabinose efflux permease
LLLLCLFGTSLSLALFAGAQNIWMLFISRALDGITGGNNSVAQAMVADTVEPKNRPKAFGLLGAAFGFGFLVGPAVGGLLSSVNLTFPFWFASGLALVGTVLGLLFLPETNHLIVKKTTKNAKDLPMNLIDWRLLINVLRLPTVGLLIIVALLFSIGQNMFIIGIQLVTVDVLHLSTLAIGSIYAANGLMNILSQTIGIKFLLRYVTSSEIVSFGLLFSVVFQLLLGVFILPVWFLVILFSYTFVPPLFPILSSLISSKTKPADQGLILGVSQSYVSLGNIIGPIAAGYIGSYYKPLMFFTAGAVFLFARAIYSRTQNN